MLFSFYRYFLYILQKTSIIYYHYLLNEFYLFSSLIISYKCTQIPTQKLGLLFNSLFFTTIINEKKVSINFSFELLEEFAIGIVLSIIISLSLFPLFATLDIENRTLLLFISSSTNVSFNYSSIFIWRSNNGKCFSFSSKNYWKMIRKTMITIQTRYSEANYEPSRLLQKIFNRKRRHFIDLTLQGLSLFYWRNNLSFFLLLRTRRFNLFINVSYMFT